MSYIVDVERGLLVLDSGEELIIVPMKLEISIDEFFEFNKPEWVQQLQNELEIAVKALDKIDNLREGYPAGFDYHHAAAAFNEAEEIASIALSEMLKLSGGISQ